MKDSLFLASWPNPSICAAIFINTSMAKCWRQLLQQRDPILGGPHVEMFANLNLISNRYRHIQKLGLEIVGKDGSEYWGPAHYLQRGHWKPLALSPGVLNSTPGCFVAICGCPQPTWPWPRPCTLDSRFTTALTTSKHFLSVSGGAKINRASQPGWTGWGED